MNTDLKLKLKLVCATLVSIALFCSLHANTDEAKPTPPKIDVGTDAQREAGKALYLKKCAQCHGDEGDGKGPAYLFLKPWPRNFTKGVYKFKTTPDDRLPTTGDIMRVIRHGNPYTGMPPWPDFSDDEVRNLAYFVKSFSKDFADPAVMEDVDVAPIPIQLPSSAPRYSEDSAKKGRVLFEGNKCIDCHGNAGRGSGTSAPTATDMDGNQIRPRDLTKRWTFRNGSTRLDVFRTLSTGIAPMPSFHNLTEEERWHLVDYVFSLGKTTSDSEDPQYANVVVAQAAEKPLEFDSVDAGEKLFAEAPRAYFPLFGQVIQPGRAFYASADGVEVRALYDDTDIALLLAWHDMSAETTQKNGPTLEVPPFDPNAAPETPGQYSDSVAIQIPTAPVEATKKPYFVFGDKALAVDLWFANLARAQGAATLYTAKSAKDMKETDGNDASVSYLSKYSEGRWTVIFKRKRFKDAGSTSFNLDQFTPIAFSVWDGFNNERGNKRALSEWFYVFLQPVRKDSVADKVFLAVALFFIAELVVIRFIRRRVKG